MANKRRSAIKRANNKNRKANEQQKVTAKENDQVVDSGEVDEEKTEVSSVGTDENVDVEKSDVVYTEVKTKLTKEEKKKAKIDEKNSKQAKKVKEAKPKKPGRIKSTFSELKKVSWPTFPKAVKQTAAVIAVVAVFMIIVLGFDVLVDWILKLITNI